MINVEDISKTYIIPLKRNSIFQLHNYEKKIAVDHLSFHINKGDLTGFIGLNGAGKSTTIKMLCGILKPDSGSIQVNGMDPFLNRKQNNKNIGVVFGQRQQLWLDLPVQDSFRLLQKMYHVSESDYKERLELMESYLDFKRLLGKQVRKLSLGEKMKCEFVASLIHWPAILYLDEPTIGIDIINRKEIRNLIKVLKQDYEKTIILTTHMLEDIDELCNRLILVNEGKLIFEGSIAEFKTIVRYEKKLCLHSINPEQLLQRLKAYQLNIQYTKNQVVEIYLEHRQIELLFTIVKELYDTGLVDDFEIKTIHVEDIMSELFMRSFREK